MVNKAAQQLGKLSYEKNKKKWKERSSKGGINRWKNAKKQPKPKKIQKNMRQDS